MGGKRGDFGALGHDRVAGQQGLRRLVHDQHEGTVPGGDQAYDAQRLVQDAQLLHEAQHAVHLALARPEELLRILGVIAEVVGDRKHFHAHGIGAGLAGLGHHDIDDLVLRASTICRARSTMAARAFMLVAAQAGCAARALAMAAATSIGIGTDQLAGGLQRDRAAQLQVTAGVVGWNRFVDRHGVLLQ